MAATTDEIATALMGALYGLVKVSLGDSDNDPTNDPFVAWCKPGIPFEPADFQFAKNMLMGQGTTEEEKMANSLFQSTQAAGFSRFVDFVPSADGIVGGDLTGGVLRPSSAQLSKVYKHVLDSMQVADLGGSEDVDAQIQALTAEAVPMEAAYMERAANYNAARDALLMARAQAGFSTTAKLEFQVKGASLMAAEKQAKQAWEVNGFKTQYETIQAEIRSLRARRNPALMLDEAVSNYDASSRGMDATFGEARFTIPFPGSFAENEKGWSDFALKLSSVDQLSSAKTTKWSASGGVGWGSLKLGAEGSGSTTQKLSINNTNNFGLKMKIAQVPLLRDWFDPWVLRSEFWRFKAGSIEEHENAVVSDGASPPNGLLIAWPVTAIFGRKIEITMDELKDETSELVKTLKAEGKGGWGFGVVNVGGSYERNSEEKKQKTHVANGALTVEGMQLLGFVCEAIGKAPNPKDGLGWVGGT